MNNKRRSEVKRIMDNLKDDVWTLVSEASASLDTCLSDEEDAYENLPDSIQYSKKGRDMERYIEALGDMIDFLNSGWYELDDKIPDMYSELDIDNG